jgi:hypothetical protein
LPQVPPLIQLQIISTIATRVSTSGPLPISVAPFTGRNLAGLDHVGLARREHELAVGNIHLAAAEVDRVQTVFDGTNDLFRIGFARSIKVLVILGIEYGRSRRPYQ